MATEIRPTLQPLHRLLSVLLVVCQVFAVAPILAPSHPNRNLKRRFHYVWCSIILTSIYGANYLHACYLESDMTTIETVLHLSQFLINCIIVTTLVVACYYYADYYDSIPKKLTLVYKQLQQYQGVTTLHNKDDLFMVLLRELRYLVYFGGSFLLSCFLADLLHTDFDIDMSLRSSGAHNVPNLLISFNLAQYWLAMRFICLLFRGFNEVLKKSLSNTTEMGVHKIGDPSKLVSSAALSAEITWFEREFPVYANKFRCDSTRLEDIRALCSDLDKLMAQLITAFGLILMLNFLCSFLDLLTQSFEVYKFYARPDLSGLVQFIYKVMWLIEHAGRILFVLLTHNAIIREKCRTCFILNQLYPISERTEHAINRFLLQLMVRKSAPSAYGIINLDLLFLGGIASALGTLIIFLIQIDLSQLSLTTGPHNKTAYNKTMNSTSLI